MAFHDFEPVRKAGLSHQEFAVLCAVSRLTVFNWVHGIRSPHDNNKDRVASNLKAVKAAVKSKELPLDKTVRGAKRITTIKRIVRQHST